MRNGRKCGRHAFNQSHAGTQMINIRSTLRTAPDLRKNVSLTVLFGSNGTSHTISTQSYVYIYIFFTIQGR
jgi:hypothetical protein